MSATESFACPRVELARYLTSDGERVIYAVRLGGIVVVSDWPADHAGRSSGSCCRSGIARWPRW